MALESVKHWNNAFTNISCHSEKRRTGNSNEIEQGSTLKTTLVEEVYCAKDKAIWRVRFEHPSQGPCGVGDHLLPDTVIVSDDTQIHVLLTSSSSCILSVSFSDQSSRARY